MKKSVRINLLVITMVLAIFVFAGIWYLRPSVPNELIEQARQRQLQPLLEIDAPIRKPVVESVTQPLVDRKALAEELLPTLTEQVSRSLEAPLYEKMKAQFASDEAFISQLKKVLSLDGQPLVQQTVTPSVPQGLQSDFNDQLELFRQEVLATIGTEQASFFSQMEGMFDSRLDSFSTDFTAEMQAYVPQLVDRMIPTLVEKLVAELALNKEKYLPYLAQEMQAYYPQGISEAELLVLYNSYRDQIVTDLVPAILAALEEPARAEVAQMVKSLTIPATVAPAAPAVVKSAVVQEAKPAPVVVPVEPVATPVKAVAPVVPADKPIVVETKVVPVEPVATPVKTVAPAPTMLPTKTVVVKPEPPKPAITLPTFAMDEPEVFVDPIVYEQKRTEIRTKAIEEVLKRIQGL
ncbi:hypothetical protein [Sphaerochaeta sp. PS]|uniref:hypothetical protein n=1 Tax=Sphaerochaeta sp. PS TaxID=3076336 RepID=UPI0028A572CD|nr:hypothetical protein [Sphaerochaeta sp. PS]MDT4761905.1 hypothetical protein [Sphaerochaeta sp. PS]